MERRAEIVNENGQVFTITTNEPLSADAPIRIRASRRPTSECGDVAQMTFLIDCRVSRKELRILHEMLRAIA